MEAIADLKAAYDEIVSAILEIPDAALDWQPDNGNWSLKFIISHLAHANDFYIMIIDEARASNLGTVRLHTELSGWQRMRVTDEAVARCRTVAAAVGYFEHTYQQLQDTLESITPDELDQQFIFYAWQPDARPVGTTLCQRVIWSCASHIREHQIQLSSTLADWRAAQERP